MNPVFCRTEFNYDMHKESKASGLACKDPSLAQQHFKEECDINTIVERFNLTGQVPQLQQLPTYEDYEGIFDFQDAMNTVREAQETFMSLPAKLRARFHNQPQEFLEFCADRANLDEARKLGILAPVVQPQETTDEPASRSVAQSQPEKQKTDSGTPVDPKRPDATKKP